MAKRRNLWDSFKQMFQDSPAIIKATEDEATEYGKSTDSDYPDKGIIDDTAKQLPPQQRDALSANKPELRKISRRVVLTLATSAAGSVLGTYAYENLFNSLGKADVNGLSADFVKDLIARPSVGDIQNTVAPYRSEQPEKKLANIVLRFDRGIPGSDQELEYLQRVKDLSNDSNVRNLIAYHMSGEYVRRGQATEANTELGSIPEAEIPEWLRLKHTVQTISLKLSALPRPVFGGSSIEWGLSKEIKRLAGLLEITPGEVPEFQREKGSLINGFKEYGGPFVHAWFFYLIYNAGMTPTREERRAIWDEILVLFRLATDPKMLEDNNLDRAVSNGLFVLAAQAHNFYDLEYRDKFLSILFGELDFWPNLDSYRTDFRSRLENQDVMVSLTVLFLESLRQKELAPEWANTNDMARGLVKELVDGDIARVPNLAIWKGIDNIRKLRGDIVDVPITFQAHAFPLELYGLYLV